MLDEEEAYIGYITYSILFFWVSLQLL